MSLNDPTPDFKQAAIDWLLTNGECESMTNSTSLALARLSVLGVDYDATDMPDFARVAIDAGDSFNEATYGEAFACTVYPLDPTQAGKSRWQRYDGAEFWVGKGDIERIMLSQMITGVIKAAETGPAGWQSRANQSEIERIQRHIEAAAERERRLAAKAATKTTKKG